MIKLIDFIYHNCSGLNKKQIHNLLLAYKDKMMIALEDGEVKAIAFYFKLCSGTLEKIRNKEINILDIDDAKRCYLENGNNIHFFSCISKKMKFIIKGIETIKEKENPKTISWFSPNMKRLFIRRFSWQSQH